jgi:hypothetical protein
LHLSLGTLSGEVAHQLRSPQPPGNPLMTLGQLLHHPEPPVELLKLVKRFAKICRNDPDNALPSQIVMLLYYGSIALAWTRRRERISDLAPATLRKGLKWLLAQPWLDGDVRTLLAEGLAQLEAVEGSPAGPAQAPAQQGE